MSKLFSKRGPAGNMFNKISDGASSMFNKFKKDPSGFINRAVDVTGRGLSALEKIVPTATNTLALAMPEFAPAIVGGGMALSKGLKGASGLLEKHGGRAQALGGLLGGRPVSQPPDTNTMGIQPAL